MSTGNGTDRSSEMVSLGTNCSAGGVDFSAAGFSDKVNKFALVDADVHIGKNQIVLLENGYII